MWTRDLLLAVLLVVGAVSARPHLPEDELAVLAEDLAEDLVDLEDARAVDEAYERLFATPASSPAAAPYDDYDGEMPQGDQPQPDPTAADAPLNASADSTAASTSDPELAAASGEDAASMRKSDRESIESPSVERDRELRLQNIKSQVLSYLGLSSHSQHPMSNISASQQQLSLLRVVGRMNLPNLPPQDIFAEKVQSHYPSCSLPRNTDETLWSGGSAMHLLFDLPNHPPPAGTSVNVVQATLRLYKVSQSNATLAATGPLCLPSSATAPSAAGDEDSPAADAPAAQEATQEAPLDTLSSQQDDQQANPLHTLLGMAAADDRQVRVSVYWYTRSLKKNKNGVVVEKRKLLDSRMLPVHGSAWTEWNVRTAVKVWRESGRNFGLVVEVEDEDGSLLNAHQFFNGMNCTQEASTARPLPSFLLDAARRLYNSNASGGHGSGSGRPGYPAAGTFAHAFNQNLFPVIDLCTVETTDGSSGGALYSSGYDTAPVATAGVAAAGAGGRQQSKAPRHKAHPQAARHRQGQGQGQGQGDQRALHHKHRHQHQDHDDSQEREREHEEREVVEPQARRWPRARGSPSPGLQGDAADHEDIRQLIIPRGIVMTAKHVQHVVRDAERARLKFN
ncbi:Esterase FrsA [Frankliniella fusca]|uniref:Esterase FrsA n=1 Tax=Frankliniella fusca TaxID=407009 RepID=A0AAE1LM18_9NEOP|nr:Esterase FrsA [Frankliniella fusca]